MPHVDEGTLHAYLDGAIDSLVSAGALPADMSRGDIDTHLATCADCRSLFEAERDVRERAGIVLRASAPALIVVPPFSEIRSEWTPRTPEIFDGPRSYVPLAWAASVLLALGAGWYGSALLRPDATQLAQSTTTSVPQSLRTDAILERDAPVAVSASPERTGPSAGDAGTGSLGFGAETEAREVAERADVPATILAGVPQRFREAVNTARTRDLTWRTVAHDDPMAQALGVVNVDGADDLRISVAALPNGLGSIARVQQRLDTGEPFELLVWREPAEVVAALESTRQLRVAEGSALASASSLAPPPATPPPPSMQARRERVAASPPRPTASVLASDALPAGEHRILALMRDDMTYVAIHGAIGTSRLTGLADRLVEIR